MTANDVIAAWKNPTARADLVPDAQATIPLNPAGRSALEIDGRVEADPARCAGGLPPSTIRITVQVTSVMSCNFSCSETMWDGSCDFFTYGCCR